MRLRAARAADAGGLARIMAGWIAETPWMPRLHSLEGDRRFLARLIAEQDVIVARDWRGLLGFLARDGARVHALYLAPRARGRGLGKALLDTAKARSDRLELEVKSFSEP